MKQLSTVVLVNGAAKPRNIPVEGRNLRGHSEHEVYTANWKASSLPATPNAGSRSSSGPSPKAEAPRVRWICI
ncbi:hypothetical protein [Pontiella sulfatireligans]|uniref:hypothetical protein n=1 Tax=Pontiella sulfatireligans TaxID=2750658 RepID=UPI0014443F56|nr:hypothetical protein [Pontiella sulfatireligans]